MQASDFGWMSCLSGMLICLDAATNLLLLRAVPSFFVLFSMSPVKLRQSIVCVCVVGRLAAFCRTSEIASFNENTPGVV